MSPRVGAAVVVLGFLSGSVGTRMGVVGAGARVAGPLGAVTGQIHDGDLTIFSLASAQPSGLLNNHHL